MTRRRIAALLACLALLAPAPSAAQDPEVAPAGTTIVVVLVSDGLTLNPYGTAIVPPTACLP